MYPDMRKIPAMLTAAALAAFPSYALAEGAEPADPGAAESTVLGAARARAALPDPTKPLPLMRKALEAEAREKDGTAAKMAALQDDAGQGPVLSAVMTSPVRGAVISGHFVREGSMAGDIKLESVSGDSAVLLMPDGQKLTLRLFESSLKISR